MKRHYQFQATVPDTRVAVTEPVADYMLEAAGAKILTPEPFQSAVMNGTDPSPQGISYQERIISGHKRGQARVFDRFEPGGRREDETRLPAASGVDSRRGRLCPAPA